MAVLPPDEVFPRPVVKDVAFEMRFPNLFFLESRIGEFQLQVMEHFPQSTLAIQRQLFFAQGRDPELAQIARPQDNDAVQKIWQFTSPSGALVEVHSNRLVMRSQNHKSYRSGPGEKFRDQIEFAATRFLSVSGIPALSRVGLRYIDDCPIPARTTTCVREYYDTSLDLDRFPVETSDELAFRATATVGDARLRYSETIDFDGPRQRMVLDFDAFKEKVAARDVMTCTDQLHRMIRESFERTIKEPVLTWMRTI